VSDYCDLFLAVDLPPDLPEPVLQELKWLMGQAEMPAEMKSTDWESWGGPWRAFAGGSASHSFDGPTFPCSSGPWTGRTSMGIVDESSTRLAITEIHVTE
jgi:hypothetical protein